MTPEYKEYRESVPAFEYAELRRQRDELLALGINMRWRLSNFSKELSDARMADWGLAAADDLRGYLNIIARCESTPAKEPT